jgi:hypothetical protein
MTYRLEGTIQNNTIWIDKHQKIPLKYDIPLQSVCHILMGLFVFIYPDCVILYCPLQSVCHILMGFFVFIYPDCVILYCPLQSVCHILMGFFCILQNNTIWIDKHKKIPLKYNIPTGGDNTK